MSDENINKERKDNPEEVQGMRVKTDIKAGGDPEVPGATGDPEVPGFSPGGPA